MKASARATVDRMQNRPKKLPKLSPALRPLPAVLVAFGLLAALAGCASSSQRAVTQPPPARAEAPDVIPQWATSSLTVGELLAKGGRQLTGAQVKTALTGAVMEGAAGNTFWREMSFPDGKVTGQSKMGDGLMIDYEGVWWVDEQGRRCWMNNQQRGPTPACAYLYLLEDRYYVGEADASHKNARLEARRIRK